MDGFLSLLLFAVRLRLTLGFFCLAMGLPQDRFSQTRVQPIKKLSQREP